MMIQPEVTYTYSAQQRAAANRAKHAKLSTMKRDELRDLYIELINDGSEESTFAGVARSGGMNKSELIEQIQAVATTISDKASEEFRAVIDSPEYRRNNFFAQVRDNLEKQRAKHAKVAARLADPREMSYHLMTDLADAGVAIRVLQMVLVQEETTATLDEIKATITGHVVRGARSGTHRSTSAMSNLLEETELRMYGAVLDGMWF